MIRMKQIFFMVLLTVLVGCVTTQKAARPNSPKISSKEAARIAQEFANRENLQDEFVIAKPAKIKKELTLGSNPHWIWQVYFPSKERSLLKFYKNTFLMIEVNASHGTVENWSRR